MCCIIILSHFEFLSHSNFIGETYSKYLHNATMAVDYFFMISGFGMFLSSKRPEINLKSCLRFAGEKIKIIYPSYIISLLVGIIWMFLTRESFAKFFLKTFLFLCADLTLLQSITGATIFSHSINGVCWFLSCLFICYIISPLFLKFIDDIKDRKKCITFFVFIIILVVSLSICMSYIDGLKLAGGRIDDLWYGHPIIRCLYVMIGMFIGWIYKNTDVNVAPSLERGTYILCILYFIYRNTMVIILGKEILRFFDVLLCACLLFVVSKGKNKIVKVLSSDTMVRLGKKTMYLFLFHYPTRMIIGTLFEKYNFIDLIGEFGYFIEVLLVCLITYLLLVPMSKIDAAIRKK